jgi:hypothetical protein
MLLIDGVRYELWIPKLEEEEFEPEVLKHVEDVFGNQSIYLNIRQKLESISGTGSKIDGLAIIYGALPEWHIVEIELSTHDLYKHIVDQVSRFISGIKNPQTQREIVEAIDNKIAENDSDRLRLKKAIDPMEIHKFLSALISKPPILTIIIEENTVGLKEALDTLAHSEIKVVEFQTFAREGVGLPVHAHLFEPVSTLVTAPLRSTSLPSENSFEKELSSKDIEYGGIYFRQEYWDLFPNMHTKIEMQDTRGDIIQRNYDPKYHGRTLRKWFTEYQVKAGDKVRITSIEAKAKYLVEFLKE